MIEQGIEWRPTVTTVEGGDGRQEIWDKGAYEMMREGTGWWIRRQEYKRLRDETRTRVVEETGLGPRWAPKKETRWRGVWERTGTKADGDRGDNTEEADDGDGEEEVEGGRPVAMACRRVGWRCQRSQRNVSAGGRTMGTVRRAYG